MTNENDTDPLIELAIQLTDELNERYASAGAGSLFLLHRHRMLLFASALAG